MAALLPSIFTSLAIVLLLVYCGLLHRRLAASAELHQQQIKSLIQDMQAVNSGSMGVGRKVLGMEQNMLSFHNLLEDLVRNDPSRVSYTEAARLVEMGADIEDLMNSCGISRPEAELVSALSRSQTASSTLN
jgi:hypothetical protein